MSKDPQGENLETRQKSSVEQDSARSLSAAGGTAARPLTTLIQGGLTDYSPLSRHSSTRSRMVNRARPSVMRPGLQTRSRRQDLWPRTWEFPAGIIVAVLMLVLFGVHLGRAIANILAKEARNSGCPGYGCALTPVMPNSRHGITSPRRRLCPGSGCYFRTGRVEAWAVSRES